MSTKKIKTDPVKTVLIITVGMVLVYLFTKWRWALGFATITGILGILSDYIAKKIDFVWMKLTWLLSLIIPNILLSLLFFLFLTPIAFLSRIFGQKNQLGLKDTNSSMFINSNKKFNPASFEKPW